MDPQIKRSAVLPSDKGSLSNEGRSIATSGLWLAIILDALRKAENNDMQRQQEQAEAEQSFERALGNVGGDPSHGVIAEMAKSIQQQGQEQADGAIAMGVSMAVGAGLTLIATGVGLGMAYRQFKAADALQDGVGQLKNDLERFQGASEADLTVAETGKTVDSEIPAEFDKMAKGVESKNESAEQALKVDDQEKLASARTAKEGKIKDKEQERDDAKNKGDRFLQLPNTASNMLSPGSQAAGNILKAPHDVAASAESATAEVIKTVQQVDSSQASSYQQRAAESEREAKETASSLAQIAASQVQVPA